jgi:hypothetical protein
MDGINLLNNSRPVNPVRFGFVTSGGTPDKVKMATDNGAVPHLQAVRPRYVRVRHHTGADLMPELLPGPIARKDVSLLGRRGRSVRHPQARGGYRNHDLYTGLTHACEQSRRSSAATRSSANNGRLAMIPADHAAAWLKAGSLPQDATENFHEILNVMAVA